MPNLKVLNMAGAEVGTIELSDEVFGAEVNGAVLHSAVRAYLDESAAGYTVYPDQNRGFRRR